MDWVATDQLVEVIRAHKSPDRAIEQLDEHLGVVGLLPDGERECLIDEPLATLGDCLPDRLPCLSVLRKAMPDLTGNLWGAGHHL